MPAPIPNGGKGRPKGYPNKATRIAREAIARLVDGNTDRLQGWLDEIAQQEGALAAWNCMMAVLEYHVPKLARTMISDANGQPLNFTICVPPKRDA